jgi:cellulase/cellobiase CelA1
VTYARQSEWSTGFVAQVTIANTGSAAVNGWTLAFTFPGDQVIASAWNAAVRQTGAAVTATNLSYNRVIAPGTSTAFGFQGSWHTSDASPTAFTLNGAACTVR